MFHEVVLIALVSILPYLSAFKYTVYPTRTFNEPGSNFIANDRVDAYSSKLGFVEPNQLHHSPNSIPGVPLPLYFLNNKKKHNRKMSSRKKVKESSIYYIRLPPTPYMMVPGLGFISQPPSITPLLEAAPSPVSRPIDFNGEGFVSDDAYDNYLANRKPPMKKTRKNSRIERLNGLFYFNGRPEKVLIMPAEKSLV